MARRFLIDWANKWKLKWYRGKWRHSPCGVIPRWLTAVHCLSRSSESPGTRDTAWRLNVLQPTFPFSACRAHALSPFLSPSLYTSSKMQGATGQRWRIAIIIKIVAKNVFRIDPVWDSSPQNGGSRLVRAGSAKLWFTTFSSEQSTAQSWHLAANTQNFIWKMWFKVLGLHQSRFLGPPPI